MPDKKVYKIDVGSPLIRYEGNWGPGPDIDPEKKKCVSTYLAGRTKYSKRSQDMTKIPMSSVPSMRSAPRLLSSLGRRYTLLEHIVRAFPDQSSMLMSNVAAHLFNGIIRVELDGKLFGPLDPEQTEQFQIDLFNATDLQPGMHTLKLSTVPSTDKNDKTTVSLDYVRIRSYHGYYIGI
jgi:hypothetical protein